MMRGVHMNNQHYILMFLLLLVIAPATSFAESFRCGSHIIKEGMEKDKVLEYCGHPTSERGWTMVYDRGPEKLNMLVHIGADGTVNRIEEESEE
jgi:hypothetical protein